VNVMQNWQNYALSIAMCTALYLIICGVQKLFLCARDIQENNKTLSGLIAVAFILIISFAYFLVLIFTSSLEPVHYFLALSSLITAIFVRLAAKANHDLAVNLTKSEALEHYYATHDDLTGLPNLTFFNEQLEHILDKAKQDDIEVALLLIDLNRFKLINETLGHLAGDAMLEKIANRIRTALRKTDLIARIGGDEFAVLINPVVAHGHIHTISMNIAESVQEPLATQGKPTDVGVSIGVATFPKHASNSFTLFEKARSAMITAEKQGDKVLIYDADATDSHIEDIQIIGMLQRATQEEQLTILYQPQVRLSDEKVISAEALIRWQHPIYGLLDPGRFIPYAEKAGLIYEINLWLLKNVSNLLIEWKEKNIYLPIAMNITAHGFLNKEFQQELNTLIKNKSWIARMLKIELTETSRIDNVDAIRAAMTKYKKDGLSFSLDDYGTKHASLEYLKRLPFDELKIDQSFMVNAATDEDSRVIIQHVKEIAQQMKLTTTAEGIESEEVLEIAKEYKINNGQGYYFSSAIDKEKLESNYK